MYLSNKYNEMLGFNIFFLYFLIVVYLSKLLLIQVVALIVRDNIVTLNKADSVQSKHKFRIE